MLVLNSRLGMHACIELVTVEEIQRRKKFVWLLFVGSYEILNRHSYLNSL